MGIFDRFKRSRRRGTVPADPGPEMIDYIFSLMKIDQDWSVREPRAFTWW